MAEPDEGTKKVARAIYNCFAIEPSDKSFEALIDVWLRAAKAAMDAYDRHTDPTEYMTFHDWEE